MPRLPLMVQPKAPPYPLQVLLWQAPQRQAPLPLEAVVALRKDWQQVRKLEGSVKDGEKLQALLPPAAGLKLQ